jgi:elongation factor P
MQYSTAEFRKGLKIELEGAPFAIVDFQHVKPGKGGAFVRTKLKSLVSGKALDRTFRSGEKVDVPDLEEKNMIYLYSDDSGFHFMDNETYEQMILTKNQIGSALGYLKENVAVDVLFHNKKPIGVELPYFLELRVAETVPGVRGNTVSGSTKPAKLETGATIQIPLFINEGDIVKVDTRTGDYIERVS